MKFNFFFKSILIFSLCSLALIVNKKFISNYFPFFKNSNNKQINLENCLNYENRYIRSFNENSKLIEHCIKKHVLKK